MHISGFGQTGPRSREAGFGSIGEAVGGIRHTTGNPELPPTPSRHQPRRLARCDVRRDRCARRARPTPRATGKGQEVDVAIYEAVAALMESTMADYELGGVLRGRSGSVLPGVAPSNVYPTADGSEILIAGNADSVFAGCARRWIGRSLPPTTRYATHGARGTNMAELDDASSAPGPRR